MNITKAYILKILRKLYITKLIMSSHYTELKNHLCIALIFH